MGLNDISELISARGPHQTTFNAAEGGTVSSVDGDEIRVKIAGFDNGKQVYATVPFIKKTTGAPSPGDPVALHSDSAGNPFYAVVLA